MITSQLKVIRKKTVGDSAGLHGHWSFIGVRDRFVSVLLPGLGAEGLPSCASISRAVIWVALHCWPGAVHNCLNGVSRTSMA